MGSWTVHSEKQLLQVIQEFPPKLKQAMYAASHDLKLKRGTWDNCAFNAASGGVVNSYTSAAHFFDIDVEKVTRFIHIWDAREGTDEENSQFLRDAIQQVGLFTEPSTEKIRVVKKTVFQAVPLEELEITAEDVCGAEFLLNSELQNA